MSVFLLVRAIPRKHCDCQSIWKTDKGDDSLMLKISLTSPTTHWRINSIIPIV